MRIIMNFIYKFPAVRGIQANTEYYISMVPMKFLNKLFSDVTDNNVLPEFRAQRKLNELRIPEIANYILDNRNSYVFSALSASIDGDFKFIQSNEFSNVGVLEVDMNATFLINDGQHRKAAIERALLEDGTLGDETISIVFFKDEGLIRSQQMFTDLNKHAVKASNSMATLYDSRDTLAVATKKIINKIPFFKKFTDKEKDNLGKNSSNLFTLNNIYKANQKIIKGTCSESDEDFLLNYWSLICKYIIEWQEVLNRELTKKDLRENYIITLAITMLALGRLGAWFYENKEVNMEEYLQKLSRIDWLRGNSDWQNRVIKSNGKVQNNDEAVRLTCSKIKQLIGIELSKEEKEKESLLVKSKGNK